jgi:molybdopterin molybdotransferase
MTKPVGRPSDEGDVRMRGFTHRARVEDVLAWIDAEVPQLSGETVDLAHLAGRVLASEIVSPVDVPCFDRAMMDGYAVQAADTAGASSYNRLPLTIVGEVLPGERFGGRLEAGQAVGIMTGAPIPAGANAVLPAEVVEREGNVVFALDQVPPGKHVGRRGEDIAESTTVLGRGRLLRPQDLGVLSSIGVPAAPVVKRPRVRIVVTGNELLPAGSRPDENRITDSNSPMLAALIARDGGMPLNRGIVSDQPEAILQAMRDDADVIVVSGGSSVGREDFGPTLLATHGSLQFHGVAMRPSSPTGMGLLGKRFVFLLPGNPVSCLCAYDFFAARAIRILAGRDRSWPYREVQAPLARKLISAVGRVDYARVTLQGGQVEPLAVGGASALSSTTRADGFVVIPADSEGHPQGSSVTVWLYD